MKNKRASNIEVKKINRNRTFRYISKFDRISKPEIAAALGISLPTVLQNTKDLISLGLVQEAGEFQSTGGRKASAITIVKDAYTAIGIDITRHHIGLVLTDLSGRILIHERFYKLFENHSTYYKEMAQRVQQFKVKYIPEGTRFLGYGLSVPGIIDKENKTILYSHALNLSNLPCSTVSQFIQDPCVFINDANSAGFAEIYHESHFENAIYLLLSQSMGGTFIRENNEILSDEPLGDTLYMGDNNRSCEFGHMTLFPGGLNCYCGKSGCADSYCSSKVLSRETKGDLEAFFKKLASGDSQMQPIWEEYLNNLSIVINNLRMLYDSKVIIGGEVGCFISPYLEQLKERVSHRNTFENDASYVTVCTYNVESSALGAALVQIERFINRI